MSEGNFYEKAVVPAGEANLIKDKSAAHELAIIEDTEGRSKALEREKALRRQHETGLTDQERANIAFNEGLVAKYPHSFSAVTNNDRVCYELKPLVDAVGEEKYEGARAFLTPEGIFIFSAYSRSVPSERERFDKTMKGVNATELLALIAQVKERAERKGKPLGADFLEVPREIGEKICKDKYPQGYALQLLNPFVRDEEMRLQNFKDTLKRVEDNRSQLEPITVKVAPTVAEVLERF